MTVRKEPPVAERHVATGMTTAFLGDERTLREFVIGDAVKARLEASGERVVLYLFNDSFDPLRIRQLRIAVQKNEKLMKQFERFCGLPIAEVPDPFECHESYSRHFAQGLLERLASLDIRPVLVDAHEAYGNGLYAPMIRTTFEHYETICEELAGRFGRQHTKDLFRAQCPRCRRVDTTEIEQVRNTEVRFRCGQCDTSTLERPDAIKGKLSWKLDCAARWNQYRIDYEVFSKAHVADQSSAPVARFLSQRYFGGSAPTIEPYGDLKISRDLSYQLLEILPPQMLKTLLASNQSRDLSLTRESVETFCSRFEVRKGMSYLDYVRRELSLHAVCDQSVLPTEPSGPIDIPTLVEFGTRFSQFWYGRRYELRLPDSALLASIETVTASRAHEVIAYALSLRTPPGQDWRAVKRQIKAYLDAQEPSPTLYRCLRTIFGQTDGPNVTTLLAVLPAPYLVTVGQRLRTLTQGPCRMEAA